MPGFSSRQRFFRVTEKMKGAEAVGFFISFKGNYREIICEFRIFKNPGSQEYFQNIDKGFLLRFPDLEGPLDSGRLKSENA